MEKRFISRSLLVTFIFALAIFPLLMIFLPNKASDNQKALQQDKQLLAKLQKHMLSATPTLTITPLPQDFLLLLKQEKKVIPSVSPAMTVQPTVMRLVIQAQDVSTWATYTKNSTVASGFSFSYPNSLHVMYKKDPSQSNGYEFLFTQAEQSQVMTIHTYQPVSSVQKFITTYYADTLSYEIFGKIGSEILYRLHIKSSISPTDPLLTTFGSRGLVLGKKHAYIISFDTNPDHAMIDSIETNVWPSFLFQ